MDKKALSLRILIVFGAILAILVSWAFNFLVGSQTREQVLLVAPKQTASASTPAPSPQASTSPDGMTIVNLSFAGGLGLFKDEKGVYVTRSSGKLLIQGLDPKTLVFIPAPYGNAYFKDATTVYYEDGQDYYSTDTPRLVQGADAKTFKGTPDFSLESDTWSIQSPYYEAEDVYHKYVQGRMVAEVKNVDLINLKGGYFKDKDAMYQTSKVSCRQKVCDGPLVIMNEYDPATFVFIGECYSNEPGDREADVNYYTKDKDAVYCGDKLIKDADPQTFKVIGQAEEPGIEWISFAVDKDHVFQGGQIIKGADPKTFKVPAVLEIRG